MTRTLMIALVAATFATTASAQVTPSSVAAQLQKAGIEDIVVYSGRETLRATGTRAGETVEFAFDRRTGAQVDAKAGPSREERAEVRGFIEGLRATYDANTDGSFRDFVSASAASAGISLPDRGPRGGAENAERGPRGGGDRPDRGPQGDRPAPGAGVDRPAPEAPRG